ncbi:hypothetical protein INT45_006801 [Circinella minor]|uniref:Tropomyosin n=1 Tax=Circinella minor TaxID=1195481 RepID=A0A8H7VC84_9FUNG|nr:hypothetical protein INT45_006801 [Circinella minor]
MEKFKERILSLRSEAEKVNTTADELEQKVKHLQSEQIAKNHELASIKNRVKILEEQLEKTEQKLKETTLKFNESDLKAEEYEHKVTELENLILEKEQKNEELSKEYKFIKAEMDEMSRQFDDL